MVINKTLFLPMKILGTCAMSVLMWISISVLPMHAAGEPVVTLVRVVKSQHKLQLWAGSEVVREFYVTFGQKFDWTNGCVALSNGDMDVVWALVRDGTPIEVGP